MERDAFIEKFQKNGFGSEEAAIVAWNAQHESEPPPEVLVNPTPTAEMMATLEATAPSATTLVLLAPDAIDESPLNPRKTFVDVEELAADVKVHGILQPVLVRPKGKRFELVFGARRLRAAKLAALKFVPAMVRELDDAKALEIMIVENAKRADVHPMEEAEGYEQLHTRFGLSVDDLAAKVGKSRAYVYARMKLLDLQPDARQAFYDGKLTASVALLVARVPASLQADALKELDDAAMNAALDDEKNVDPVGAREAADILRRRYTLRLAEAPFDRADETLVPSAGSCKDCPKRSGNQKELFADVPGADVCTDPVCFAAKREASAAKVRAKLEAKGMSVVDGKRETYGVRVPSGYVRPNDFCPEAGKTFGELAKPAKVAKKLEGARVVMLDEKNKPVELLKKADVVAAAGVKQRKAGGHQAPTPELLRAQEMRREADEIAERRAAAKIVEKVEAAGLGDSLLRIACAAIAPHGIDMKGIAERRGWKVRNGWDAKYSDEFAKLKGAALLGLLVELALCDRGNQDELAAACELLKIDFKTMRAAALAELKTAEKAKAAASDEKPAKKAKKARRG